MTRLWAQILKELLSYLRDPRTRLILIGPPLMQLLIFSSAVTLEVKNVSVVVVNEDAGRLSQELIARLRAASFVHDVRLIERPQSAERLIDRRKALVALRIPADFSRRIAAGETAVSQLLVDGRRANGGQIAASYIESIATDLAAEEAAAAGRSAPRATAVVRSWFNPNLEFKWFVLPSLVAVLSMVSSIIICALSIARERELGTFDQLLVSPARPLEIVIGKTVPAVLIGTLLGCLMIVAGVFVFRVPFTGSPGLLVGSLVLFILSVVGIGLMISSVCQTQQQAILGTFAAVIPLVLTSGFATPVENMPQWLQTFAEVNPAKYFLIISEGSFTKSLSAVQVGANAWPLVAIAVATLGAATLLVKRALD